MNDKKIYVVYPIDELALDPAYYGGFELIRCKDCKHFAQMDQFKFCELLFGKHGANAEVYDDSFCSWAERAEDETD